MYRRKFKHGRQNAIEYPREQTRHKHMNHLSKTILLTASLGAGLSLSSCVAPYGGGVATTYTTRSYSPGYSVNSLPRGYRSETIAGRNYYYNNGNYYQRRNNNYVVVQAPRKSRYYNEYSRYGKQQPYNNRSRGSRVIKTLPRGYETVNYRGQSYYRSQNNFYRRQGNGYVTVARPY